MGPQVVTEFVGSLLKFGSIEMSQHVGHDGRRLHRMRRDQEWFQVAGLNAAAKVREIWSLTAFDWRLTACVAICTTQFSEQHSAPHMAS